VLRGSPTDNIAPHRTRLAQSDFAAVRAALDDPAVRRGMREGFQCGGVSDALTELIVTDGARALTRNVTGCLSGTREDRSLMSFYRAAINAIVAAPPLPRPRP